MKTEFLLIPNALDGNDYVVNIGEIREIIGTTWEGKPATEIGFNSHGPSTILDVPIATVLDLLKKYRENQQ